VALVEVVEITLTKQLEEKVETVEMLKVQQHLEQHPHLEKVVL
jgi:hypothetical protein